MNAPAFQLESVEPVTQTVTLADLKIDPDLQCRAAGINKRTVAEYAEAVRGGAVFPPIVVFVDSKGTHWLADGFHRHAAWSTLPDVVEIPAELRQGSRKDALIHAASANASHGLRRTTADKRRTIELVVGNFPKWSNRKIGEVTGVDHKTVKATRDRLVQPAPDGGEIPRGEAPTPEPIDTLAPLVKRFSKLLADVPAEQLAAFTEQVTDLLTAPAQPTGEA